tara:strand:+ start:125 stop:772 length:648 start_codon:yes stop_codon:yes gene_type:complete
MTSNQKQKILTAVIKTYGTSVTRKNLIEFEQAGRGNCAFIGMLYRSGRGKYQLPTVYGEAETDQHVTQHEYNRALNRAWEAMNPKSPEQRDIRPAKRRKQRTPEQRQREYRAWKAKESPEKRTIRIAKQREYNASRTPEQRAKHREYNREYQRVRYANVEERRERDSRCLKPYPKSYRDKVLANYAAKGLRVSQRMLDELNGNRDPQTPPLFRRS